MDWTEFFADGGLLAIALLVVAVAIVLVGLVSLVVSVWLTVSYIKYNRRPNSAGLTGEETARRILDNNGLQHIKVKVTGSLMFGNSYSHYFKKVRLRRMTRGKTSLTALAMGSQKAALAVLDKEGDPDMQKRVKLIPLITFGPFAFIPLIVLGALFDILIFNASGYFMLALCVLSLLFYVFAIVLSVMTLKTEKKAQARACDLLRTEGLATEEEITDMQGLFRLYNIQYINDIILSSLELLYRVLELVAAVSGNGSFGSSDSR